MTGLWDGKVTAAEPEGKQGDHRSSHENSGFCREERGRWKPGLDRGYIWMVESTGLAGASDTAGGEMSSVKV